MTLAIREMLFNSEEDARNFTDYVDGHDGRPMELDLRQDGATVTVVDTSEDGRDPVWLHHECLHARFVEWPTARSKFHSDLGERGDDDHDDDDDDDDDDEHDDEHERDHVDAIMMRLIPMTELLTCSCLAVPWCCCSLCEGRHCQA
jgi:hypothetical protein